MERKLEIVPEWMMPERKSFKRCKPFEAYEKKRLQMLKKKESHTITKYSPRNEDEAFVICSCHNLVFLSGAVGMDEPTTTTTTPTTDRRARFLDLFAAVALVGFAVEFLCIYLLMWFKVSVILVEPSGFILATKIGIAFVVVVLGANLLRRLWKSGGSSSGEKP